MLSLTISWAFSLQMSLGMDLRLQHILVCYRQIRSTLEVNMMLQSSLHVIVLYRYGGC